MRAMSATRPDAAPLVLYFHIGVRPLRCSFYCDGRCQSLKVWDEQQVRTPRFLFYQSYSHKPTAQGPGTGSKPYSIWIDYYTICTGGRLGNASSRHYVSASSRLSRYKPKAPTTALNLFSESPSLTSFLMDGNFRSTHRAAQHMQL